MATLLLSAAGSALGGAIGGTFLGLSAAGIGQAVGAVAGGLIDQRLLGGGSRAVETGRARGLRILSATEGAPIPQVYARMRVAGEIIWSTRFLETVRTSSRGGKATGGNVTVRDYNYSISLAVGICEGPIDRIGRVWADGKLMDLAEIAHRVYLGEDTQLPDPKIEAVEGSENAPAYRGTAYVVFEDLPVGPYGNRVPQLNFEVFRSVERTDGDPEAGTPLSTLIKGVALSPGTGEFALDPEPARYVFPAGGGKFANMNNTSSQPDLVEALDQLGDQLPECEAVSLIVSWFGDDLRASACTVRPKIEEAGRVAEPEPWEVSGETTATAQVVSLDAESRPRFGGTPSDSTVIRAIQELQGRGHKVMFYPFLLMDIEADNTLPNPYGDDPGQPAFPWRGRITLDHAPGRPGSADQTAAAATAVAAFFGTAAASDFAVTPEGAVTYSGPAEWSWRRFVLHSAALCQAAGGVEAFCIGSEFRELTTIRSAKTVYPAVAELIALAAEVRALLPGAKISYAADWSEYFGHQPNDGTGDRLFHLDPLWADGNIDFIGIDDYLPLSDWRYSRTHLDQEAGAKSVYSLAYLKSQVEGGEHYDYFYASEDDRLAQLRTPIADTAHGEHWVFRPKDLKSWWRNPHHDRIDGVRQATPTAWVPESKPIWLTETGCPAVDLGANQPNLFFDPKSSESAVPPGSAGARDDEMMRRFLQAKLGHWQEAANNPVSAVYGGPMIPDARVFVWTWDARPWPDFPVRESVWSDGPQHRLGHWLSGRVTAGALADIVWDITKRAGVENIDVSLLYGAVDGYVIERTGTAREAIQPLMLGYGFDAFESGGGLHYVLRGLCGETELDPAWLVETETGLGALTRERESDGTGPDAVRLSYIQSESDYRVGAVEAWMPDGDLGRVNETSLPIALSGSKAQSMVDRWLAESLRAKDRVRFAMPPSDLALEPGDTVVLPGPGEPERYRIERITQGAAREAEATRIDSSFLVPSATAERRVEPELPLIPGPLTAVFLDLPLATGGDADHHPRLAVAAQPWPGPVAVYRSATDSDYAAITAISKPALIGALAEDLPAGSGAFWQRVSVTVTLPAGAASSAERLAVLNGANTLAVEAAPGLWELLQFQEALLTGPAEFRLSRLLRGRRGTEHLAAAVIPAGARVVVLDDAVQPVPMADDLRGLLRHYRVGPASEPFTAESYLHSEETFFGVGLRPYAPAQLRARREAGTGDIAVSWLRRTRVGGDSWEGFDVPLGEAVEAYRLRIYQGPALLREATPASPAYTYTAAQQAADGAAGPLDIRVAQLSQSYGYGPEKGTRFDG